MYLAAFCRVAERAYAQPWMDGQRLNRFFCWVENFCAAGSVDVLTCIFPLWTCLRWNPSQKETATFTNLQAYKGWMFDAFEHWWVITLKGCMCFWVHKCLHGRNISSSCLLLIFMVSIKTSEHDILSTYRNKWNTKPGMKLKMPLILYPNCQIICC